MTPNLSAKFSYLIKKEQRKADAAYNQPVTRSWPAFLGDNNGVITAYEGVELPENYVVVRDFDGHLSVAYNDIAPLLPVGVIVGYEPDQPTRFKVLSVRDYLTVNPSAPIANHHKLHEWPGGDTVFVHSEQYLPALLVANTGLSVYIYPFFFKKSTGDRGYYPGEAIDLTASVPASGAQAFTLAVDDSSVIQILPGSAQISLGLISIADFPINLDVTLHDLWGIRLYSGQTVIRQLAGPCDVFDFRMGGIQGGGGDGGISDAPSDGTPYVREDAGWVQVLAIDGGDAASY